MGKKNKHPCKGCVWKIQISESKALCPFPKCVRGEYARLWPRRGEKKHEESKDH